MTTTKKRRFDLLTDEATDQLISELSTAQPEETALPHI